MILTACTIDQFNDLPHSRWLSLHGAKEVKIGSNTVGIKIGRECSFKAFKTAKEAQSVFDILRRG